MNNFAAFYILLAVEARANLPDTYEEFIFLREYFNYC